MVLILISYEWNQQLSAVSVNAQQMSNRDDLRLTVYFVASHELEFDRLAWRVRLGERTRYLQKSDLLARACT